MKKRLAKTLPASRLPRVTPIDAETAMQWLTPSRIAARDQGAARPKDWPVQAVIDRAGPGLASLVNSHSFPRDVFAHVKVEMPPHQLVVNNADLAAALRTAEIELLAVLSRASIDRLADRNPLVSIHASLRDVLGMAPWRFTPDLMVRRGPATPRWADARLLRAMRDEVRTILVSAGLRLNTSAGNRPEGLVAEFLARALRHLYPDDRLRPTAGKIAEILNRAPKSR